MELLVVVIVVHKKKKNTNKANFNCCFTKCCKQIKINVVRQLERSTDTRTLTQRDKPINYIHRYTYVYSIMYMHIMEMSNGKFVHTICM